MILVLSLLSVDGVVVDDSVHFDVAVLMVLLLMLSVVKRWLNGLIGMNLVVW